MSPNIAELQQKRRYASLLMTYACTIACDHCCFSGSPRQPDVAVSVDDAVRWLGQLHQLDRLVHIAGGEPFRYWDRLRDVVRAAGAQGVAPHFVESNGSWCASDAVTRERFEELRRHGVRWMYISTDCYHLKHVPVERVARGVRIAEEVFGHATTMGKDAPEDLERRAVLARDPEQMARYVAEHPPKLLGRAAKVLAKHVPLRPLSEFDLDMGWGRDPDHTCNPGWDPLWEIHVDPYGNLQTNCGVLLGNAHDVPITELTQTWHQRNPILRDFSTHSVAWLLEAATRYGFEPAREYPQKCCLCGTLRAFLRQRDEAFRAVFGPDEVYE